MSGARSTKPVANPRYRTQTMPSAAGLNRWQWDLCSTPIAAPPTGGRGGGGGGFGGGGCQGGGRMAQPGVYKVSVSVGGKEIGAHNFKVLEDIWLNEK
jgi:hypothetical protein